jgi:hypothetical protein
VLLSQGLWSVDKSIEGGREPVYSLKGHGCPRLFVFMWLTVGGHLGCKWAGLVEAQLQATSIHTFVAGFFRLSKCPHVSVGLWAQSGKGPVGRC